MKIATSVIILLTLCSVVTYLYIVRYYPTYQWKQKLTVTLDTPNGVVSGSSVVGITWTKVIKLLPDMPSEKYQITGEATVIALPDGRHLFALLKGAEFTALNAFAGERIPAQQQDLGFGYLPAASKIGEHLGETKTLSPGSYPSLVVVAALGDSARAIDIQPIGELTLGSGYLIRAVDISITDEPVVVGAVDRALGPEFFRVKGDQDKAMLKQVGPFGKLPFSFQLTRENFLSHD